MSLDFNFTVASWFLGNVHVKPISTHSVGRGALRLGPGKCCRFIALKAAAAVLYRFVSSIQSVF